MGGVPQPHEVTGTAQCASYIGVYSGSLSAGTATLMSGQYTYYSVTYTATSWVVTPSDDDGAGCTYTYSRSLTTVAPTGGLFYGTFSNGGAIACPRLTSGALASATSFLAANGFSSSCFQSGKYVLDTYSGYAVFLSGAAASAQNCMALFAGQQGSNNAHVNAFALGGEIVVDDSSSTDVSLQYTAPAGSPNAASDWLFLEMATKAGIVLYVYDSGASCYLNISLAIVADTSCAVPAGSFTPASSVSCSTPSMGFSNLPATGGACGCFCGNEYANYANPSSYSQGVYVPSAAGCTARACALANTPVDGGDLWGCSGYSYMSSAAQAASAYTARWMSQADFVGNISAQLGQMFDGSSAASGCVTTVYQLPPDPSKAYLDSPAGRYPPALAGAQLTYTNFPILWGQGDCTSRDWFTSPSIISSTLCASSSCNSPAPTTVSVTASLTLSGCTVATFDAAAQAAFVSVVATQLGVSVGSVTILSVADAAATGRRRLVASAGVAVTFQVKASASASIPNTAALASKLQTTIGSGSSSPLATALQANPVLASVVTGVVSTTPAGPAAPTACGAMTAAPAYAVPPLGAPVSFGFTGDCPSSVTSVMLNRGQCISRLTVVAATLNSFTLQSAAPPGTMDSKGNLCSGSNITFFASGASYCWGGSDSSGTIVDQVTWGQTVVFPVVSAAYYRYVAVGTCDGGFTVSTSSQAVRGHPATPLAALVGVAVGAALAL